MSTMSSTHELAVTSPEIFAEKKVEPQTPEEALSDMSESRKGIESEENAVTSESEENELSVTSPGIFEETKAELKTHKGLLPVICESQEATKNEENTIGSQSEDDALIPKRRQRKRKLKDDIAENIITDDFLNVYYSLSPCMSKSMTVAISKQVKFTPLVVLRHNRKRISFDENAWESLNKYLHLIKCYLSNRVNGKKTKIVLDDSNIEVENVKMRGDQCVKFRDVTKHAEKITLHPCEFVKLIAVVPAINRYLKQLTQSLPMIHDYLINTIESNTHLLYGPVDNSIYNRLPQEVYLFRCMKAKMDKTYSGYEQCSSHDLYQEESHDFETTEALGTS